MKLNLGSHNKNIEGYVNCDILDLENVEYVFDLTDDYYPFANNSIEAILMEEVLEHISFRHTNKVLKECFRILKSGGKLDIQVPDIREMMFCYWNKQICDCVPHKPKNIKDAKAKLNCPKCNGYGKVNPNRWLYAFTGAQKHKYDAHLNIFTPEILEKALLEVGFRKIQISQDDYGWKIKVKAIKI